MRAPCRIRSPKISPKAAAPATAPGAAASVSRPRCAKAVSAGDMTETGVIIVGGGIAGAGAAFEISRSCRVVLLERESHCGYHATGRSAASFTENYGNGIIRRIVLASRDFLTGPPAGFCDYPLLSNR